MVLDRASLDDAGVVHDAREQGVLRAGRHDDAPAIRLDQLSVRGEIVQGTLVDTQVDQLPAAEGQCFRTAGAQRDRSQLRADDALVRDLIAEQGDVAAVRGLNRPLIDDTARTGPAEAAQVGTERRVAHVERRSGQSADVDLRALAEQDAIGIDQPDLPIRIETPEYLTAAVAQDAVDRNRRRARLNEIDDFVGRDIETLPVQEQVGARLPNGGGIARLADSARTRRDLRTAGGRQRQSPMVEQCDQQSQCGHVAPRRGATPSAAALHGAASFLGNRHPLAGRTTQHQAEDAIHE